MGRDSLRDTELMVMLALLRVRQDAYGIPLSREIKRCSGRELPLANIYAILERLERRGFVVAWMGEPIAERGGRAKKYFRVSGAGLRAIRDTQRMFIKLWQGVPEIEGGAA